MWGIAIGLGGVLLKKAGQWTARRALGAAARTGARTVGGAVLRSAGGAVVGTAAVGAASGIYGRMTRPTLSVPQFGPQGGGGPMPREGKIGRTVSRILPGGMSGREFMPYGEMTDKYGRSVAVYPEEVVQVRGPRGYVVVNVNGERIAVQSRVAQKMGLYTPPPKPPVSGYDMRAINRAASAKKRVAKLAKRTGMKCSAR